MSEIKVMSSNGVAGLFRELAPAFERANAHVLAITWGPTNGLRKKIEEAAPFDVAILTAEAIDGLIKQGTIVGPRRDLARSGVGVAVRAGAAKPDLRTADAFKRALLEAQSVAYSAQGASGVYFASLLDRLGIAASMKAKSKVVASGPTAELVARGEAELAIQQISELLPVAGIEVAGPFPPELQLFSTFSAGLSASAAEKAGAQAFVDFLSAQKSSPLLKEAGLEPP